jgi:hypothetical protein
VTAYDNNSQPGTIYPGIYKASYKANGSLLNPAIHIGGSVTVKMMPGIYYLEGGGMTIDSGATVDATGGVMIYNGQQNGATNNPASVGPINVSGNAVVKLTALSAAQNPAYAGIAIFQDRNATATMSITGGGGTDIEGGIYAAKALVKVTGGSNVTPGTLFISAQLDIGGSGNFTLPKPPFPLPDPSRPQVRLVE